MRSEGFSLYFGGLGVEACSLDAAFAFASVRGTTAVESLLPCLYGECGSCAVRIFDRQSFRDIGHNGPKKTTPPLLFPTSVPFLTHVNFSRVFLRFYHSQGIRTNIHPETKSAKSFFHEPFLFSAMFVCKFPGKKTWRPVAATLAQTSHPKNTHRGNFAVQRLGKRKAPCQMWLSQKCLTVRPWAVF